MDAASAVAPTLTVHPLPLGAPVKIVPLAAAAAAFLGISEQPCGGVADGRVHPIVASALLVAGLVPVVTDMTPDKVVPVTVALPPLPAALPLPTLGDAPAPVTCCVCTTLVATVPPATELIMAAPTLFTRKINHPPVGTSKYKLGSPVPPPTNPRRDPLSLVPFSVKLL